MFIYLFYINEHIFFLLLVVLFLLLAELWGGGEREKFAFFLALALGIFFRVFSISRNLLDESFKSNAFFL